MSSSLYNDTVLELHSQLKVYSPQWAKSGGCFTKLRLWCLASQHNPQCRKYFDSIASISRERERQCEHSRRWIIHPFSLIRFIWNIIMTFIYAISFVIIPYMTTFIVFDYEYVRLDKISLVLYAFFWCDCFLNLITGVYRKAKKIVILDQTAILKNYMKSYFFLDIFTSLPYDHITLPWRSIPGPQSSLLIALINLMPLLKSLRYITFHSYVSQIFAYFEIKDFSQRMVSKLLLSFYVIYWFTCLSYLTPIIVIYIYGVSIDECACWLTKVRTEGINGRFQRALFIVFENFVGSGYGGIEPEFSGHMMICTVLMLMGIICEAYIVIMILQIHNDKKASMTEYRETMNQIVAYTRQKQMPLYMKKRLETYYRYRFRNSCFQEKKILSSLSEKLRDEIVLHSCRRLVENVLLFRNLSKDIIMSILSRLRIEFYLPNDTIVKAGSQGDCMFFLSSGTVAIYTPTGKEVCHLDEGSHFGEVALLMQDKRRIASVVAIEVCEVYRLDRRDFCAVITVHRELFEKIERIATVRVEKTNFIEEQHQRGPQRRTRRFENNHN